MTAVRDSELAGRGASQADKGGTQETIQGEGAIEGARAWQSKEEEKKKKNTIRCWERERARLTERQRDSETARHRDRDTDRRRDK